ncbi:MAG: glycerol-3-phosphate acyltransferase [Oscillospiraceae bacterium]|nr:glycerol-3-phosphate acyltransferase [Oscillospiraceae bacterium]
MYYLLLIITAILAYGFGSLSTLTIASLYVYKKNLRKLGRGNVWLSNFRRIYGFGGLLVLLLVELVKDILPVVIGGLLLGIKGHADVGRVFAGFCLIVGRQWPLFYDLKGSFATVAIIVTAFFTDLSVGIAALAAAALLIWLTKYLSLGSLAAAAVTLVTALLVVEQRLLVYLSLAVLLVVLARNIPCVIRIFRGTETKLSLEKDLSYKFDGGYDR